MFVLAAVAATAVAAAYSAAVADTLSAWVGAAFLVLTLLVGPEQACAVLLWAAVTVTRRAHAQARALGAVAARVVRAAAASASAVATAAALSLSLRLASGASNVRLRYLVWRRRRTLLTPPRAAADVTPATHTTVPRPTADGGAWLRKRGRSPPTCAPAAPHL